MIWIQATYLAVCFAIFDTAFAFDNLALPQNTHAVPIKGVHVSLSDKRSGFPRILKLLTEPPAI